MDQGGMWRTKIYSRFLTSLFGDFRQIIVDGSWQFFSRVYVSFYLTIGSESLCDDLGIFDFLTLTIGGGVW